MHLASPRRQGASHEDRARFHQTRERRLAATSAQRRIRAGGLGALAACLVLLACGGGEAAGAGDATEKAEAGASASAASSAGTHSHEDGEDHAHGEGSHTHAAADTLVSGAALEPASGAAWTGSATLLAVGDSLRVLVSVEGAPGGSRHPAELVAGSCDRPGPELASLTPVAAGSSGEGSSQTTLPASRLDGHGHGALRMTTADGSPAACAPVHLTLSEHEHG